MSSFSLKTAATATVQHAALASLRQAFGIEHAITLWPEWAWAVASLDKRVENRGWRLPDSLVGKRIAIHAGASIGGRKGLPAARAGIEAVLATACGAGWTVEQEAEDPDALVFTSGLTYRRLVPADIVLSAIVCTAVLESCTAPSVPAPNDGWYMGEYGFRLADVHVLPAPIHCPGAQGFWRLSA